jgi:hypothetical protein
MNVPTNAEMAVLFITYSISTINYSNTITIQYMNRCISLRCSIRYTWNCARLNTQQLRMRFTQLLTFN